MDFIIKLMTNDIQCNITPDSFTFQSGESFLCLKTYVLLSNDAIPRIVGIGGDDFSGAHTCERIMLFAHDNNENDNKGELLGAFLRHAFSKVQRRGVFVRPKVIFKNIGCLREYLSGYQQDILKLAAEQAGAREIVFSD